MKTLTLPQSVLFSSVALSLALGYGLAALSQESANGARAYWTGQRDFVNEQKSDALHRLLRPSPFEPDPNN